ncbi:hypothetical protein GGF46_002692 [Coemansia sp. RSA 552]|nr:hypothetical protein GGF46_002692 [Coemansia sp. RSA 552]
MAYARPLGQTFNQLNLNMYRLPDGQRGALRSTSLALARESTQDDRDNESHHNPFRGIKRLYSGLRRRHHARARARSSDDDDDDTRLRKYYSTPMDSKGSGETRSRLSSVLAHHSNSTPTGRPLSDGDVSEDALDSTTTTDTSRSSSRSAKHVHFARREPIVRDTYSPEEYDRRVVDPWEFMTKEKRERIRSEMNDYTSNGMVLNDVYNTNSSEFCTLCWRKRCYCRPLSKDIWRRAKSTSIMRAGA